MWGWGGGGERWKEMEGLWAEVGRGWEGLRVVRMREVGRLSPPGDQASIYLPLALVGRGPNKGYPHAQATYRPYRLPSTHLDVPLRALSRQGRAQPNHRHFGRRVVGLAEVTVESRRAGDVDDAAVPLLAHVRPRGANDLEDALDVHHLHEVPVLVGHLAVRCGLSRGVGSVMVGWVCGKGGLVYCMARMSGDHARPGIR